MMNMRDRNGLFLAVFLVLIASCRSVKHEPQQTAVRELFEYKDITVDAWFPRFADTTVLLLKDTLSTQCWLKGAPLIEESLAGSKDLRMLDSCLCWQVRYRRRVSLDEGTHRYEAVDSVLVARLERDGSGEYQYSEPLKHPSVRYFAFETSAVLLFDTLFVENLGYGNMVLVASKYFATRERP